MNLINIEKITKSYTERKLFDNASFSLQEGEKVGIIGITGNVMLFIIKILENIEYFNAEINEEFLTVTVKISVPTAYGPVL